MLFSPLIVHSFGSVLDTSCILAWLIEQGYEVYAFMADVGQEEDFKAAEVKALRVGAKKFFLAVSHSVLTCRYKCHTPRQDLKREFVTELIYPAVQTNCIYEVRSYLSVVVVTEICFGDFRMFIFLEHHSRAP